MKKLQEKSIAIYSIWSSYTHISNAEYHRRATQCNLEKIAHGTVSYLYRYLSDLYFVIDILSKGVKQRTSVTYDEFSRVIQSSITNYLPEVWVYYSGELGQLYKFAFGEVSIHDYSISRVGSGNIIWLVYQMRECVVDYVCNKYSKNELATLCSGYTKIFI